MKKYSLLSIALLFVSINGFAQSGTALNLMCVVNGEISSMSGGGVTNVPIKDLPMSVLVEKGVISISDGSNYFSNKMAALVEENRIFGSDTWKQGDNDDRKQYIEINRNTGMVKVVKDISFSNPTVILKASASGNCEKLANKKKF
ncbi:hypothetical protein [Polynucleobacter sp. JS-Polo-80-F4]|uniref:hypothetical protein n=1 Tax=Polynucleobacter sp. JS-Polo-80-F4 TaxID=2576918 RepID=UPI001C0C9B99|nr:hypothetical protein [Polynucleobacter sp. JS-Polo-80-F4]MBU3617325.1 hypothetical protein [Polynucleobacter sp. JS-Polo-80-F4]